MHERFGLRWKLFGVSQSFCTDGVDDRVLASVIIEFACLGSGDASEDGNRSVVVIAGDFGGDGGGERWRGW